VEVARAGKRPLLRFAGRGCSAPRLSGIIRSSKLGPVDRSSVSRPRHGRLACQPEVTRSAASRLQALRSGETKGGENGAVPACWCGSRSPEIVRVALWKRASQLAERPLARAHRVGIPSGLLATFAGPRHRVGSPARRFVPRDEIPSSAKTTTPFVRGPGPRLRSNGERLFGAAARFAVRGSPLRFAGNGSSGHIWSGFVSLDARRVRFLTDDGTERGGTRRRNVERVSPGDEPGGVLRGKEALESVEPQERQRHETRPQGVVRIKPPRV